MYLPKFWISNKKMLREESKLVSRLWETGWFCRPQTCQDAKRSLHLPSARAFAKL